jgi:ribonucleoside-triphosphate reductase
VPYFGTNTPVDSCGKCGFMGEAHATPEGFACPQCGNRDSASLSVTRRVCGYLGSPNSRPFNAGKQKEVMRRVKHLATPRLARQS